MIDSDDPTSIVEVDFERDILTHLEAMDPDARLAFEKLIIWLSERPKDSEPLSQRQMDEMVEEIRLENIRRRLGGKVGRILPFKKPTSTRAFLA